VFLESLALSVSVVETLIDLVLDLLAHRLAGLVVVVTVLSVLSSGSLAERTMLEALVVVLLSGQRLEVLSSKTLTLEVLSGQNLSVDVLTRQNLSLDVLSGQNLSLDVLALNERALGEVAGDVRVSVGGTRHLDHAAGLCEQDRGFDDSLVDRLRDNDLAVLNDVTVQDGLDLFDHLSVDVLLHDGGVLGDVHVGLSLDADGLRHHLGGDGSIVVDEKLLLREGASRVLRGVHNGLVHRLDDLSNFLLLNVASEDRLNMLLLMEVELLLSEGDIAGDYGDSGGLSLDVLSLEVLSLQMLSTAETDEVLSLEVTLLLLEQALLVSLLLGERIVGVVVRHYIVFEESKK